METTNLGDNLEVVMQDHHQQQLRQQQQQMEKLKEQQEQEQQVMGMYWYILDFQFLLFYLIRLVCPLIYLLIFLKIHYLHIL